MAQIASLSMPWDIIGSKLSEYLPASLRNNSDFSWETDAVAFLKKNANVWFAVGFLYLPLVFGIKHQARIFKPLRPLVKLIWGLWNVGLASFSVVGACFSAREFFSMVSNFSGTCETPTPALSGETGQWVFYFIVSKMFELGDSVFLALLDKPINFLHWYHHLTIFTFMYFSGLSWHPHLISGCFWNYNVHSVMYAYYAGSCFGISWPSALAMAVTSLQVLQMFAQIGLTVSSVWLCGANNVGHYAALVMYAVYFILFVDFFLGKYSQKGKREEKKKSE